MSTPNHYSRLAQSAYGALISPAGASLALRDATQPLPFHAPLTRVSQRARFTLRINGARTGGNFDRLVDAVEAIQGKPLGNNYEIFAGERRIFTFGVCLCPGAEISLPSSRPRRLRPELS